MNDPHYAAHVAVEQVSRQTPPGIARQRREVFRVTLRDRNLDSLKLRLAKHVELIEDDA